MVTLVEILRGRGEGVRSEHVHPTTDPVFDRGSWELPGLHNWAQALLVGAGHDQIDHHARRPIERETPLVGRRAERRVSCTD